MSNINTIESSPNQLASFEYLYGKTTAITKQKYTIRSRANLIEKNVLVDTGMYNLII